MKCLIVIDMQNDFITGALGTERAKEILPNVIDKVKNYDGRVYYTQDTHSPDTYFDTEEGKKLPILHCIPNTDGWNLPKELYDSIAKKDHDSVRKSTFASEELVNKLRDFDFENSCRIEEIEIVGVCTNICVISNALLIKSYMPEIPIKVDASCCAGSSVDAHNRALKVMEDCHIDVTNVFTHFCDQCECYRIRLSGPYCSKGIKDNIKNGTGACENFEKVNFNL